MKETVMHSEPLGSVWQLQGLMAAKGGEILMTQKAQVGRSRDRHDQFGVGKAT